MTDPHQHAHGDPGSPEVAAQDPRTHWEERYSAPVWSGKVNATLAAAVAELTPGRSLDLGCGEGGDVLWLAEQGWQATGLDLSTRAIERARTEAAARGLAPAESGAEGVAGSDGAAARGSARFEARDLETWEPEPGGVDLVAASFFHSEVALQRVEILRRAAGALAPGGHLVVLSHAAPPPWASGHHDHAARMLSAAEEAAQLDLDPGRFTVVVAEQRERPATAPDGRTEMLEDSLLVLRRR